MYRIILYTIITFTLFSTENLMAQAQGVVRGPYLQMGTTEGMTIRWRSNSPEKGRLVYGTDYNNLNGAAVENGNDTIDHEITLTGLQANTKYFYKIGRDGGSLYGDQDSTFYFKTSPVKGTKQPIRIWTIGDFGNGSFQQQDVKEAYQDEVGEEHTDMWIWLGDNAYGDGTDQEYQDKNFNIYREVFNNHVIWPCPGNHDYKSVNLNNEGPYYDILTLPTNGEAGGVPSGKEGYFSWDYGNVHLISLNSENLLWTLSAQTDMGNWLKEDLDSTDADWIIAFWHQPPYTKSTHDSDDALSRSEMMRAAYNPLLEQYGVDLILGGHSHGYERSFPIKGHFGKSNTFNPAGMMLDSTNGNPDDGNFYVKNRFGSNPNQGTIYSVVGCSGQKGDGNHPLNHPAMYISTEEYWGSMIIDINGKQLDAKFLTKDGDIIDRFRVVKKDSINDIVSAPEVKGNKLPPLRLYPNPGKGTFIVDYVIDEPGRYTLTLVSNDGRLLRTFFDEEKQPGNYTLTYDVAADGLAGGWYHVMLKDQNHRSRTQQWIRVE